jgi:hypothetical protein
MDLLYGDYDDIRACVILDGLAQTPRFRVALEDPARAGYASVVRVDKSVVIIVGVVFRSDEPIPVSGMLPPAAQSLVLMDREGNMLDSVACSLKGGSKREIFPTGRLTVDDDPAQAQFTVRCLPYAGSTFPSELRHEIKHAGRTREFEWRANPTQWEQKGLCRVAVRNDKFEVLWPPLAGKDAK